MPDEIEQLPNCIWLTDYSDWEETAVFETKVSEINSVDAKELIFDKENIKIGIDDKNKVVLSLTLNIDATSNVYAIYPMPGDKVLFWMGEYQFKLIEIVSHKPRPIMFG